MPKSTKLEAVVMPNGSFIVYDLPLRGGYCDAYFKPDHSLMCAEFKSKGCTGMVPIKRNSEDWHYVETRGLEIFEKTPKNKEVSDVGFDKTQKPGNLLGQ